jgi:hypothetical protein
MKMLKHLRNSALAMSAAATTMVPTAFAATLSGTSLAIVKAILDLVQTLGLTIGVILLAWSVIMLILAFKNEDADSKSRAIMLLVVSIALIGIGGFLKPILKEAGVTI